MDENSGISGFRLKPVFSQSGSLMTGIIGSTVALGDFKIDFVGEGATIQDTFYSSLLSSGPHKFTENVLERLRLYQNGKNRVIGLDPNHLSSDEPNLIIYQVNAQLPFEIDIVFNTLPNLSKFFQVKTYAKKTALVFFMKNFY